MRLPPVRVKTARPADCQWLYRTGSHTRSLNGFEKRDAMATLNDVHSSPPVIMRGRVNG